jgi:hypothetical protein
MNSARKIDYFEERLRASTLERCIAARIPVLFRWLLFVPTGLVTGVCGFAITLVLWVLFAPISGDEDAISFGGIAAGALGGLSSVLVGMIVAPHATRVVAFIMAGASVVLTATVLLLAWRSHDFENRMASLVDGGIYSSCAVIAAFVFGKPEDPELQPNKNKGK